jgi:hypothetical protein
MEALSLIPANSSILDIVTEVKSVLATDKYEERNWMELQKKEQLARIANLEMSTANMKKQEALAILP